MSLVQHSTHIKDTNGPCGVETPVTAFTENDGRSFPTIAQSTHEIFHDNILSVNWLIAPIKSKTVTPARTIKSHAAITRRDQLA